MGLICVIFVITSEAKRESPMRFIFDERLSKSTRTVIGVDNDDMVPMGDEGAIPKSAKKEPAITANSSSPHAANFRRLSALKAADVARRARPFDQARSSLIGSAISFD